MFTVRQTDRYSDWVLSLRDARARTRIVARIDRLIAGHLGDFRSLKDGVSELRIDYGPGYRVYFTRRGREIILLLCGGDKHSQDRDIALAKAMVQSLKD